MDNSLSDVTRRYEHVEARRSLTALVLAKSLSTGFEELQGDLARRLGPRTANLERATKAATALLQGGDAGLTALRPLEGPWADLVKRITILGRAPGTRAVPRGAPITVVDTGAAARFVTEGSAIPCVRPTLTGQTLMPGRIAGIIPYAEALIRMTNGQAELSIERDGSRALAVAEDTALLDGLASVAGGRPASILFGLSAVGGGGSPASIEADVLALLAAVRAAIVSRPSLSRRHRARGICWPNVIAAGCDSSRM